MTGAVYRDQHRLEHRWRECGFNYVCERCGGLWMVFCIGRVTQPCEPNPDREPYWTLTR